MNGNIRGNAVVSSPPAPIETASGQIIRFSLLRINSLQDFQHALGIDVDVSVSYAFFKGSGSFEFSEEQKFHSDSEYLVAKVTVENPMHLIRDVKVNRQCFAITCEQSGTTLS